MSEQLHEQISAFVDGELPEHETGLLLRRLERDRELQQAYARFVVMGAVMRREPLGNRTNSLAQRVRTAVAQENAGGGFKGSRPALRRPGRWMKALAGAAVAATVAAVAILGVQQLQSPGDQSPGNDTQATQVAAVPQAEIIGVPQSSEPDSYIVPAPSSERRVMPAARLTSYVVAHSEYSSLGRRNVLSDVVAEDPVPPEETRTEEPAAAPQP
jgi:sigma-E factor negative regulatory protein RseA